MAIHRHESIGRICDVLDLSLQSFYVLIAFPAIFAFDVRLNAAESCGASHAFVPRNYPLHHHKMFLAGKVDWTAIEVPATPKEGTPSFNHLLWGGHNSIANVFR
jgi:hypothetical protein